ncbi:MAG: hypothetical protein HYU60_03030 [Magnetospirillum sp.]|nr:hypothetical protein [Magnetospirillum sp.]
MKNELVQSLPTKNVGASAVAVDEICASSFVVKNSRGGIDVYFISLTGIKIVDSWSDYEYAKAADGFDFPESDGFEHVASIPASDRTVTVDHNQPEYVEAVAALDKVIEEFVSDHRLDNELGHEKGALHQALEAGRGLLRDTVINVKIGTALLIEPLRRIAEKYDSAVVGALAKEAIEKILALFN